MNAWHQHRMEVEERRAAERAARSHHEQQRLNRERADLLRHRIEMAFTILGWAFIAAGVAVYIGTAPPIGGLDWSFIEVFVSIVLIMGGSIVLLSRKLP